MSRNQTGYVVHNIYKDGTREIIGEKKTLTKAKELAWKQEDDIHVIIMKWRSTPSNFILKPWGELKPLL